MLVSEIMTPDPYAATSTTSIRRVMSMLLEADVRHLPVVDDGELVGIVSDRDLRSVNALGDEEAWTESAANVLAQPASTVMSTDVLTVNPDTDVTEAIDLMIEHRVGAIPVVEADGSKLVGIVSYIDALRAARDRI